MFKFKLQPVLKYREFLEDQKKMELAEKQRVYLHNRQRGDMLRQMRHDYHEAMRLEAAKEDVSVTRMSFFQSYIFVIEKQIIAQDDKTRKAYFEMKRAQQALVEARKHKEVMVRASERALEKYKYEEAMQLQKMLDDVSSIKYTRMKQGLDESALATRI
jgi:flagellar protein FliJ